MIRKKIALICFCVLCVFKVVSMNPKIIDTLEIHKQIKVFDIDEEILNFKSNFFSSIVFKNDSILYYNPNGTLHLFEISLGENTNVSKISKSVYSGHNFNRHLFIHNDIIFSLGGQGLFNSFPGIIYFESNLSGWLEMDIKNYPFDTKSVLNSWKKGNKIMVLLNHYSASEYNKSDEVCKFSFGEINLTTFKYQQHFTFESPDTDLRLIKEDYFYDSDFYSIYGSYEDKGKIAYRVFDKKSGISTRTSNLDALERVNGISYVYIKDSSVFYRSDNGKIKSFGVNSGTIIHTKDLLKQYKGRVNNIFSHTIIATIIAILISLLFFNIKRRKENKLSNNKVDNTLYIEEKLIRFKNSIITKEKLDELFNISHYSYETIKTRRSMIINHINENGNLLITRVRKKDDKRFYDYKIS